MWKKYKSEVILILLSFLIVLAFLSTWWAWWNGGSWGLRHINFLMPFLMIPIFFIFKKIDTGILLILIGAAIVTNLTGFQESYEDMLVDLKNSSELKSEYQKRVYSFRVLEDPLHSVYFSQFIRYGPRSRIFSSLYNGKWNVDIRDFKPMDLTPQFLTLIPLTLIVLIIWRKEIFNRIKMMVS
jgi:hypothetical protein